MERPQMLTNRHPADELAALRAQIHELKAREGELRRALLHGTCGLQGDDHRVVMRKQRRRVFLKDRLPERVLSDPDLWETRYVTEQKPALRAVRPGDPVLMHEVSEDWGTPSFEVIEGDRSAHQFG